METTKEATAATHPHPSRCCVVTVGATASFRPLLAAVLAAPFLDLLGGLGFDELVVQTGVADDAWAAARSQELVSSTSAAAPPWPGIQTLPYTTDLAALMLPCRGGCGRSGSSGSIRRAPGVVVAHAGAGTILEAARLDVPLVVVSNPALLDDHQAELAEAVAAAGWAVRGVLASSDGGQWLADAVRQAVARADAEAEARRRKGGVENDENAAAYREPPFPTAEAERCGLFDWAAVYAGAAGRGAEEEAVLLRME